MLIYCVLFGTTGTSELSCEFLIRGIKIYERLKNSSTSIGFVVGIVESLQAASSSEFAAPACLYARIQAAKANGVKVGAGATQVLITRSITGAIDSRDWGLLIRLVTPDCIDAGHGVHVLNGMNLDDFEGKVRDVQVQAVEKSFTDLMRIGESVENPLATQDAIQNILSLTLALKASNLWPGFPSDLVTELKELEIMVRASLIEDPSAVDNFGELESCKVAMDHRKGRFFKSLTSFPTGMYVHGGCQTLIDGHYAAKGWGVDLAHALIAANSLKEPTVEECIKDGELFVPSQAGAANWANSLFN
jgi:hypothetical protein